MNETERHEPCLPAGFRIGHWTDEEAITGCSVILCPAQTVGGCDVRGNSPGSRELALLDSERSMQEVHAVLLTGGSAFGLAAADGVVRFLEETGIGYETPWARIPIVPAAVIFDLNVGSPSVRPDARAGYTACMAASAEVARMGRVGAGLGATVGKWAGFKSRMTGGFGVASHRLETVVVTAVAVVNALGDVYDDRGEILAGARDPAGGFAAHSSAEGVAAPFPGMGRLENTTLVALLTNAKLTKVEVNRLAQRAHDGMARAIRPVHTSYDGDIAFALASGPEPVLFDLLAEVGAEVTARAIRAAVTNAR